MYHNQVKESDTVGSFTYRTMNNYNPYKTQYADDYNYIQEMQQRQEEEWRRKRQEEKEKWMKDKPKTFDYTAPYQAYNPPRDVNKYFHDSKYLNGNHEEKPDEYYFNEFEVYQSPPTIAHTTYEKTYVHPWRAVGQQPPGGLYIIRFHDVGYDDVKLTLREQQTIVKSSGGYVLGIARKHNVIVIEGDQEWTYSRQQTQRHHVTIPHRVVDDALAVLWFPNRDKAFDFFSNSFRNRFRQQGFPHPSGYWEGHFVPLLTPPFLKTLDTYLILELPNAARYRQEDLQQFEAEARQSVLKVMPDSLPFVASALRGREAFKPGSLFKVKSKVFLSRFNSMGELAEAWKTGVIQDAMQRYGISGPMNVSAFSLKDWID